MNLVVYRITNLRNRRVYIGSTGDFETRKSEHLGQLRTGKHCNRFLQIDFNDFKETAFVFEVIADGFKSRERMLLKEYELILKTKGYNYNIDTNCPIPSTTKRSKSIRRVGKLYRGAPNKRQPTKKKKWGVKIKTEFPKLDAIIERKKEREKMRRT